MMAKVTDTRVTWAKVGSALKPRLHSPIALSLERSTVFDFMQTVLRLITRVSTRLFKVPIQHVQETQYHTLHVKQTSYDYTT